MTSPTPIALAVPSVRVLPDKPRTPCPKATTSRVSDARKHTQGGWRCAGMHMIYRHEA